MTRCELFGALGCGALLALTLAAAAWGGMRLWCAYDDMGGGEPC